MSRFRIPWLALVACLALLVWSTIEARRVARLAGECEVAARRAAATAQDERRLGMGERQRAEEADARCRALQAQALRLESELDGALTYAHALGETLTQESEARERAAVARAAADAIMSVPPPLGVQRCLLAMRECLRQDGFTALRPLRASGIDDFVLRDVEFLDVGAGIAAADLIVAARMTAVLDRRAGELALRFFEGSRRLHGVRSDLPAEGLCVRLRPVAGSMWETCLPYLVRAEGDYPQSPSAARVAEVGALDTVTKAQWLERFDLLLAEAGTELDLRVTGFEALRDGRFRSARMFGYDRGRLLALAVDCEELAVEIDERAGIVSLLMREGTLRREGVQSTIHREGYRMLLPSISPEQATDRMTGMVVRR